MNTQAPSSLFIGLLIIAAFSLSGRFGDVANTLIPSDRRGWRTYALIDVCGNWMFWLGLTLFLPGYVMTNLFVISKNILWFTAVGYTLAMLGSIQVTIAFVWRTIMLKRAPFYLGAVVRSVVLILFNALVFLSKGLIRRIKKNKTREES